jgi:Spy/CpxP family protein refolding chaperone
MKTTLQKASLLALLALAAAALGAGAQGRQGGPGGQGGPPLLGHAGRALHELDLSREQQSRIREVVREAAEAGIGGQVRAFEEARRELDSLIWDPSSTEQEVLAASQALAGLAEQRAMAQHALARDILEILTVEQREDFLQALEEMPQGPPGQGRPGNSGGGPGSNRYGGSGSPPGSGPFAGPAR